MVAFSSLAVALAMAVSSFAAPTENVARESEPDFELNMTKDLIKRQDYNQDYVTSGTVNFSPSSNGYSVTYSGAGDFVVGKGWTTGSTSRYVLCPFMFYVC